MGLISPQQVSDGTTADATDVNTPINTIANEFNGNIDNANIKAAAAIDASKLLAGSITDTQFSTAVSPVTRTLDNAINWVASGCVWSGDSYGGSLAASMTAGVVNVSGVRATVGAVTARAFTASKDTYVDISTAGAITYTEVANNAASPALSAGNVRVAIIVSGATIAAATSVNQGQTTMVLPIASSIPYAVTDSLGNLICNRSSTSRLLGFRQIITTFTTTTTPAYVDVTGLSMPIIVPTGRKVKLTAYSPRAGHTSSAAVLTWAVRESSTAIQNSLMTTYGGYIPLVAETIITPSAGLHTYLASVSCNTAGTTSVFAGDSSTATTAGPTFIKAELV